ncbi:hypothetical protein [Capnocytophaga endodontalis]|uniref:Uncharacterized protein n=1 Tax=Capnocytophaga endodontalis TaxID=2708117 RepID=A0A1Z4BSA1_9FLAO|nr:hypothetical protein [Capnocytophaga endodontalis]ASF44120.1 hypothetical protein CBG49_14030 [Capnocytophaga endodontalis]
MNTFVTIFLIVLIIAIILFVYFAKLYLQKRKNLFVKKERMDKLTFNYIREYFQKEKVEDKNYVPVLIKMAQENPYNIEKETDVDFYTLSFFHKEKQTVLTEKTQIVITKSIDSNLSDALNGKGLLIFENL